MLIIAVFVPSVALAYDDEYGSRFYNQEHPGFGGQQTQEEEVQNIAMDDLASDLQDIQPAAGDENEAEAQDEQGLSLEEQEKESKSDSAQQE